MGQAKARGTYEQRKAQAIERKAREAAERKAAQAARQLAIPVIQREQANQNRTERRHQAIRRIATGVGLAAIMSVQTRERQG